MRKNIVAGNWKMNNDLAMTESLITELKKQSQTSNAEVMIAPTFTNLWHAFEALRQSNIEVIAQNMHFAESGAYTG
ncbi:MAG: triose-phosphate isomerase, partial [Xanthomarina gelatinilytica]|nr:triose-phosphate isomerase [Xanthomarina gelatinilytica]